MTIKQLKQAKEKLLKIADNLKEQGIETSFNEVILNIEIEINAIRETH